LRALRNLFLAILLTCTAIAHAETADTTEPKRFQATPLPVLLYDPFTGFGYGGLVSVNYLLGDAKTTRYSNSHIFFIHTTHRQTAIQLNHQVFLKNENLLWQGKFQYLDWPEYVYGLGAHTEGDPPTKELISYKAIELEERLMVRLGSGKNFIGPQYRLYQCWDPTSNLPDSASFFEQNAIGNKGFIASGIGVHFVHDSRDNVQNAYSGSYFEIAINPYVKFMGSTENWTNFRIDHRFYKSLSKKYTRVIATRVLCEQAAGEVPYLVVPMPGRYYATRGYVQGRYRGKTFASAEIEYRSHLWHKLGYVVFSNAHTVSEPNGGIKYINPALGAGLRLMLNKLHRINLRIDYARGLNDNGGLYFQLTEVF